MKKLLLLFIFLLFPLIIIRAKDYSDCDSVRIEDFKKVYDLENYIGRIIPIEIQEPYCLNFLDDSHFIYTEWKQSPLLRIVDIDSLDCFGYINAGVGQFDMFSIGDIQVRPDSTVTVYDGSTGKFFELKWEPPMNLHLVSSNQFNQEIVFSVTKLGEKDFIWSGNSGTCYLCHRRDSKGKVISFSTIPDVPKEENIQVSDYDVQTKIIWNDARQRLVTAAKPWDIITLYDGDLNLIKRMRGPLFIERFIKNNKGVTHVPYPAIHGYSGSIQMGDKGFCVAYGGMNEKREDNKTFLQYIISFDWDGNPLLVIKSEKPGLAYAFNIDSGNLLLVTEEDGRLIMNQYGLYAPDSN